MIAPKDWRKRLKIVRTRFAPSPTGYLHLGHAHAALFAQAQGDDFILRIEDIDQGRCRPEFSAALIDDLSWLGLSWPEPVRYQSRHFADYARALDQLRILDLLYPCFCSRADITHAGHAPHGPDGPLYPGTCRGLSPTERQSRMAQNRPFCLRLNTERAVQLTGPLCWTDRATGRQTAQPQIFGDVVLARKDIPTSYHLSVVVDDALQGIDLVTRGQDLYQATHIHRLLQALLQLPTPLYHHHGLITGADGARLAKRDQAQTLRALRAQGKTPQHIKALAGFP